MRNEPRRSYLSALTFSRKPPQRRSESAPSRLSTKDAAKGAATFLAGAAGAAMSVKRSLDMNARISAGFPRQGLDPLKLTPTEIVSSALVRGAASAAGMAALVDLNNTGTTPVSRVVRAVGAGLVAPVVLHATSAVAGFNPGVRKIGAYNSFVNEENEFRAITDQNSWEPSFGRVRRPFL
jgi:hypothetical protein